MIKKIKNKKGFTLVELIVVLVILAILAAILVPALLGWIDRARDEQTLLTANLFYKSVQSVAVEEYAKDNAYSEAAGNKCTYEAISNDVTPPDNDEDHKRIKKIYQLMDAGSIDKKFKAIAIVNRGIVEQARYQDIKSGKVWELTNASSWDYVGTYGDDEWAKELLGIVNKNDPNVNFNKDRIWWNGN